MPTFNIIQRVPTGQPVTIDDGAGGDVVVGGIDCSILPIEVSGGLVQQLLSIIGDGLRKGHSYCSLPGDNGDFSLVSDIEKFLSTNGMPPLTEADWQVLRDGLLDLVRTFRPDELEWIDTESVDALWSALDCF